MKIKKFFRKIKRKFREWNLNRRIRSRELVMTPRGICYYEYMEKIAKDELAPDEYIASYEEGVEAMMAIASKRLENVEKFSKKDLRKVCAMAHCIRFKQAYDMAKEGLNGELD